MASTTVGDRRAQVPSVVILGTDAVLAAAPATPVQLAHACLAAGYTAVVPQSWGDELLAMACTQQVAKRSTSPAIFCACPLVANRLLGVGSDLGQFMISLVAPPVATARYVRALYRGAAVRVTYVGRCPSGGDESIDARVVPTEFLTMLAEREIDVLAQPEVFDSVIPPDRRRFASLPGGLPSPDALRREGSERMIGELSGSDLPTQLTRELLSQGTALLDLSLRQGCVCSGAAPGVEPSVARALVAAIEPPRSATPVIDTAIAVKVELPLPRGSRDPADIVAATSLSTSSASAPPPAPPPIVSLPASAPAAVTAMPPSAPVSVPVAEPAPPMRAADAPVAMSESDEQTGSLRRRAPASSAQRSLSGVLPTARRSEGGHLPRAYVARRRPSHAVAQLPDDVGSVAGTQQMLREAPLDLLADGSHDGARDAARDTSRDVQRETQRVIEHSVEPPPTPTSSRWASVPAAATPALVTESPLLAPPAPEAPPAAPQTPHAETPFDAVHRTPLSPSFPTSPPETPRPVAPRPNAPTEAHGPTPGHTPARVPGQVRARAGNETIAAAPRAAEPPALLRGLRFELLIAAAVGVGLIAGIVAGRRMDDTAAAAPLAGEANARPDSTAQPPRVPASAPQNAERAPVAPLRDSSHAAGARVEPARRPRARQPQRARGSATTPLSGSGARGATDPSRGTASDTAVPSAPAREPEVAPMAADALTPAERETLERELRVRRARLDSLARRLDSLRPAPEAPPPVL